MSDRSRLNSDAVHERLRRRAAEVRARSAIRRWEYRQRHNAKGTWFRLRRVLADARQVFATSEAVVQRIVG